MTVPAGPPAPRTSVALRGVVHLYPSIEGDVVALRGVDLDVPAGTTVALQGPSGAGKSTVIGLLAGSFVASAGQVLVAGEDVGRMSPARLARLRATEVSLVVQDAARNLLPYATVAENVWFSQRGATGHGAPPAVGAEGLLDAFGVAHLAGRTCATLTAGQQQLIAVITGVAPLPGLLLLDEPTSRLDGEARDIVLAAVSSVSDRWGITVVLVTHDAVAAAAMGRTVTIRDGRIGSEGRQGVDYAVVAPDGSLQLPEHALGVLPPGSLVEAIVRPDGVDLRRREP